MTCCTVRLAKELAFICADEDLPCVCTVEGDPMLASFDGVIKLILKEQKTILSNGKHNNTDTCKYLLRAQTDDDFPGKEGQVYLHWIAFSVGVHKNPNKGHYRAIQVFQDQVGLRGPGIKGLQTIGLPHTLNMNLNYPNPVTVEIRESADGKVVTIDSPTCPYKVEFTRGGFESKVVLSVGDRYKPENNNGVQMTGMCSDCNDVMANDYHLCDAARTDVTAEADRLLQMSDSCQSGQHQHKD